MKAQVDNQSIIITSTDLVSQSVGIYECEFEFDTSWDGWSKTVVFRLNEETAYEVVLLTNTVIIPHECLAHSGYLTVGVYGTQSSKIKPTVWSSKLIVEVGVEDGATGTTPTPSVYAQILEELEKIEEATADAETLPAGSSATATRQETATGYNYHFGIPKGDKGDKGDTGDCNFATFELNPETGILSAIYSPDVGDITFAINNDGILEVTIA